MAKMEWQMGDTVQPEDLNQIGHEINENAADLSDHKSAAVLDHPDGSVTTAKLADGAVTAAKVAADVAKTADLNAKVSKSGDTMTGKLTALGGIDVEVPVVPTGKVGVMWANGATGQLHYHDLNGHQVVWTTGNDGAGSGLDADMLDGLHASDFLQNSGGTMTGRLTVQYGVGGENGGGQINVKPNSGGNGRRGIVSLYSTFGGSIPDTNPRRTVDIVAGFDGGAWGNEYLGLHVGKNGVSNDGEDITEEVARFTKYGMTIKGDTVVDRVNNAGYTRAYVKNATQVIDMRSYWEAGITQYSDIQSGDIAAGTPSLLRLNPGGGLVTVNDYAAWHAGNLPIESGTWTPNLLFDGSSTGVSYQSRFGTYSRILNVVFFSLGISINGKGAGIATIAGLPFTPSSTSYISGSVGEITGYTLPTSGYTITWTIQNTPIIWLRAAINGGISTALSSGYINTPSSIYISGFYYI